jgi:hypothetical protein
LLLNSCMRRRAPGRKKLRLERSLGSRIVLYAGDLVILCERGKAEEPLQRMRAIRGKRKLTVNDERASICKVTDGTEIRHARDQTLTCRVNMLARRGDHIGKPVLMESLVGPFF